MKKGLNCYIVILCLLGISFFPINEQTNEGNNEENNENTIDDVTNNGNVNDEVYYTNFSIIVKNITNTKG